MTLKDQRGMEVREGNLLIDARGRMYRVLPLNQAFSNEQVVAVQEMSVSQSNHWRSKGEPTYARLYTTFWVALPEMPLRQEDRAARYQSLYEPLRERKREELRERRRSVHADLVTRGIRQ